MITAAISPYAQARAEARQRIGTRASSKSSCAARSNELARDVKGLTRKPSPASCNTSRASRIRTKPEKPDVVVDSETRNGRGERLDDPRRAREARLPPDVKAELIAPHGGKLINRTADTPQADRELREEVKGLRSLTLTGRELNDFALIANGAFSPLTGFMGATTTTTS